MGERTEIEWTDASWSPWWGCTKVSAACTYCYAKVISDRFRPGSDLWRGNRQRTKDWTKPLAWNRRAERLGRPMRVFPSMCDPFDEHPDVEPWRQEFFGLCGGTVSLTWLLLTKRPQHIRAMVPPSWLTDWPANVWVGTTVEDQQRADERIPHLLRVPAPVRFLSCEPMLGPVDLSAWLGGYVNGNRVCCGHPSDGAEGPECCGCPDPEEPGVQWVIAGGESGPKARPSHPDWFRSLRDQCATAGVPFLFKQWGEWGDWMHDHGGRVRTIEEGGRPILWRVGKHAAGRLLDGVQHDGIPEVSGAR